MQTDRGGKARPSMWFSFQVQDTDGVDEICLKRWCLTQKWIKIEEFSISMALSSHRDAVMSVSINHDAVIHSDSHLWRSPHLFPPQISTYVGWEPKRAHIQKTGCVSQLPFERCILDRMRETSRANQSILAFRWSLMIITVHWLVLTWGVEQPPGDCRFRSAIGKTGESHVAAFVDNDVLWHFVDAGWNCRHKKHHTSVRSAVGHEAVFTHKPRLGAARWSFSGGIFIGSASELWC